MANTTSIDTIRRILALTASYVLLLFSISCSLDNHEANGKSNSMLMASWKKGHELPKFLLQEEKHGASCFPDPQGPFTLLYQCSNWELLTVLLVHKDVPFKHSEIALHRLIDTLGLTATSRRVLALIRKLPENAEPSKVSFLRKIFNGRIVSLQSISIEFEDIPHDSAHALLLKAKRELDSGRPIADVYKELAKKYEYQAEPEKYPDYIVTKIGNGGRSYLSSEDTTHIPFNHFSLRGFARVDTLLSLVPGESVIMQEHLLPADKQKKELGPHIFTWSQNQLVFFQAIEVVDNRPKSVSGYRQH